MFTKPNWNELRARVLEWTSQSGTYTPVWTAATTNPTIGNGVLTGVYHKRGGVCLVTILLLCGSTTSFGSGGWSFSLPFISATNSVSAVFAWLGNGLGTRFSAGGARYPFTVAIGTGSSAVSVFIPNDPAGTTATALSSSAPFTWAATDHLRIQIEYGVG